MKFTEFAKFLQKLENTASRNEMTSMLSDFLDEVNEEEIGYVMYMLIGRISPTFVPFEFNFSTKLLTRSLAKAYKIPVEDVTSEVGKFGDIGLVAESIIEKSVASKNAIPHSDSVLTISQVYSKLYELASISGQGAQEGKLNIYVDLVKNTDPVSAKYISRIITGKLRLGLSEKTIIDALSFLISGDKSNKDALEYAYGVRADIAEIAKLAKKKDIKLFKYIQVEPGTPVSSKLVQREKSVEAVFERMPVSIVQPKYDGLRTQIHYSKNGFKTDFSVKADDANSHTFTYNLLPKVKKVEIVRIFSRNMEPLTDMFPDIAKVFEKVNIDSVVLDAETIGYDAKKDKFIPFQETMTRRRKYGINDKAGEVPIKTFVFDILYLNGKDVTQLPQKERMTILKELFDKPLNAQAVLEFSKSTTVKNEGELDKLFKGALKEGLEGVIVKDPETIYKPGTRNFDWIKLKANIDKALIDTIDCVVLGYYFGRGQRAKFGAGAFLVGVYNQQTDSFETIAKVGSGIKDEDWPAIVKQVQALKVEKVPDNVKIKKELMPDIICRPEIVVVVDADEISKSSNHTAGLDESGKGFSLRFPRLKEWGRLDKKPEDVTSVDEIMALAK
jgi:DNA ligase 1